MLSVNVDITVNITDVNILTLGFWRVVCRRNRELSSRDLCVIFFVIFHFLNVSCEEQNMRLSFPVISDGLRLGKGEFRPFTFI